MSEPRPEAGEKKSGSIWAIPAVRGYSLVSLGALLIAALILLQDEAGYLAFVPVMVGIVALPTFWVAGPVLVLLLTTALYLAQPFLTGVSLYRPPTQGIDLLLAVALAVYCM